MSICDKKRAYFIRIESLTFEIQSTRILCVDCALSENDVVLNWVFWTCLRCKLTNHRMFETDHFEHKSDEKIKRMYWFVKNRFVNADILKAFERFRYRITVIDFVNDINILTYDTSITDNCKALKKTHVICELWARRHEARFVLIKYELLHLTRNHRRFDMTITINIKNVIKELITIIRVLSVQLDIKLKWNSHVKKIQNKVITQMLALIKLTIFIWRIRFKKIKQVYNVVVQFVITYDNNTWHASHDRSNTFLSLTNKFINFQKQRLSTINETFWIIFKEILNVET
jgi:hypothetical protein